MAVNTQPDTFTANGQSGQILSATDAGQGFGCLEVTGTFALTITVIGWLTSAGKTAAFPVGLASIAAPSTIVTTITAPGIYRFDATSIDRFQATTTAFTSGTATVAWNNNAIGGGP